MSEETQCRRPVNLTGVQKTHDWLKTITYLGRLNYQQAPGLLCAEAAAGWLQVPDSSSCQVPVALRCGAAALLHVSGFVC